MPAIAAVVLSSIQDSAKVKANWVSIRWRQIVTHMDIFFHMKAGRTKWVKAKAKWCEIEYLVGCVGL